MLSNSGASWVLQNLVFVSGEGSNSWIRSFACIQKIFGKMGTRRRFKVAILAQPTQLQPSNRSSKGYSAQKRPKGCLFQRLGLGECCLGNLLWLWLWRVQRRCLALAWDAAGTQVLWPKQLPPLSDKERFVVFSPLPSNVHVSLPRPFHCTVSSLFFFLFFSVAFDQGLDMLVEWQTQEVLGGAGGAQGPQGPGQKLSTMFSVYQCLRHPWPGLALLLQSLAFSLDSHDSLSEGKTAADFGPPG